MQEYKKNKMWDGEWGEARGNCSGLIKGCLIWI